MTILRRTEPGRSPAARFTHAEMALLDGKCPELERGEPRDLDFYMTTVARLGIYFARRHDPPPGKTVLWRCFSGLADLVSEFEFANPEVAEACG